MFQFNIKLIYRNFKRNRFFYLATVLGLAIGMAAVILLVLFIHHEKQYDKFHVDAKNIARVTSAVYTGEQVISAPTTIGVIGQRIRSLKGIKSTCRFEMLNDQSVCDAFNNTHTGTVLISEPSFFEVFTFPIYSEDISTPSGQKNIVLTKSYATKLFPNSEPIGKSIYFRNDTFRVAAIMKDIPKNSHLNFDMVALFDEVATEDFFSKRGIEFYTYFKYSIEADYNQLCKQIDSIARIEFIKKFTGLDFSSESNIQPLLNIHLKSNFALNNNKHKFGDKSQIYIFLLVCVFIIIVGIINFINLLSANYTQKAKELVIYKTLGSDSVNIFFQFITESIIISIIAFFIALGLVEIILPKFNEIVYREINLIYWHSFIKFFGLFMMALIVGIVSGIYPALLFRNLSANQIYSNEYQRKKGHRRMNFLFTFSQYAVVCFLVHTLIVYDGQINLVDERCTLGVRDKLLVIKDLPQPIKEKYNIFKDSLLNYEGIESVSAASTIFDKNLVVNSFWKENQSIDSATLINEFWVEDDFAETYGLNIISGGDISKGDSLKSMDILLNEKAVEELKVEQPVIGKKVYLYNKLCQIKGIISDFNYRNLRTRLEPLAIAQYSRRINYILVKCDSRQNMYRLKYEIANFLDRNNVGSAQVETYEKYVKRIHENDFKILSFLSPGTFLALLMFEIGLFALLAFYLFQKDKELGMRRLYGAGLLDILSFVTTQLKWWLLGTTFIALFFSFIYMEYILKDFAYKVHAGIFSVSLALITLFLIQGIPLLFYIASIFKTPPANSLKYE